MSRLRLLAMPAGAALLFLLVLPDTALADNCSDLSDCYSSVSAMAAVVAGISVVFIFTVWLAPDRCEGLREACRQAREEAAAAQAEAERLRHRLNELAGKQRADRAKQIRDRLAELDAAERSWMEGAGGRLEGVRLNSDDLRRLRAEEQKVRERYARGEITTEERERLLARWADADYVKENAAKWAHERAEERQRLQEELKAAEAEAAPAHRELEQAQEAAKAAEERARAAKARADEMCDAARQCEQREAKPAPGAVNGKPDERDECDVATLEAAIDAMKREFENEERELETLVDYTLGELEEFVSKFDELWVQAMNALDDYFMTRKEIAEDLGRLHAAIREMAVATHMAGWLDSELKQWFQGALIALVIYMELNALIGAVPEGEAAGLAALRRARAAAGEAAGAGEGAAAEARLLSATPAPRTPGAPREPGFPVRNDAWGRKMAAAAKDLDSETKWAIAGYTGGDYGPINRALRSGDLGQWADTVAKMDSTMAPIGEPVTVYRQAPLRSLTESGDPQAMVGKTISDTGYMSTSLQNPSALPGEVRYEIECPAGTQGRYVAPIATTPAEQEMLLARNTNLYIQSVQQDASGVWLVKARVVVP